MNSAIHLFYDAWLDIGRPSDLLEEGWVLIRETERKIIDHTISVIDSLFDIFDYINPETEDHLLDSLKYDGKIIPPQLQFNNLAYELFPKDDKPRLFHQGCPRSILNVMYACTSSGFEMQHSTTGRRRMFFPFDEYSSIFRNDIIRKCGSDKCSCQPLTQPIKEHSMFHRLPLQHRKQIHSIAELAHIGIATQRSSLGSNRRCPTCNQQDVNYITTHYESLGKCQIFYIQRYYMKLDKEVRNDTRI